MNSQLGSLYEAEGRNDEAISAYLKSASLGGENAQRVEAFRSAYKAGGMRGFRKKQIEKLKEVSKRQGVSPWAFAALYTQAGEKEQALEYLERAYQQHRPLLMWLKAGRIWDPLRSDPRFQALLRRMNFPQ